MAWHGMAWPSKPVAAIVLLGWLFLSMPSQVVFGGTDQASNEQLHRMGTSFLRHPLDGIDLGLARLLQCQYRYAQCVCNCEMGIQINRLLVKPPYGREKMLTGLSCLSFKTGCIVTTKAVKSLLVGSSSITPI